MLYPYDASTHSKHGDESPFQQFSLVTFQHRVDSAIRYLPAIAWIILREHFVNVNENLSQVLTNI